MYKVTMKNDSLEHKGVKGMKWGYNDGQRNGRRTAAELKKVAEEFNKINNGGITDNGKDIEQNYHEANNMLKYLGITLDLQSDDKAAAQTMALYNQMKNTKDKYDTQYDWLKAFSNRLASIGYDMSAVDKMLDEKKADLNKMQTGTGSGNTEKSNQDWKENDTKSSKKKSSKKKTSDDNDSEDTEEKKTTKTKSSKSKTKSSSNENTSNSNSSNSSSTTTKKSVAKTSYQVAEESKKKKATASTRKSYNYRPKSSYGGAKKYPSRSKYVKHDDINQNGDYIEHHGILGQRWGIRRYQNTDGSLTSEGREHYGYSSRKSNSTVSRLAGSHQDAKRAYKTSRVEEYEEKGVKDSINLAKNTIGTTINTARSTNKVINRIEDAEYRKKVSKMTNEELEAEIAKAMPEYEARILRQQLEQKYNKVVGNTESTKIGRDAALEAVEAVGAVALTSVAVLDLVLKIKGMK